jgi:acetoin utilization protein AcuB
MARVRDLMTSGNVVTVREDDNLGSAAQAMVWSGVHHLPVLGEGSVVGVVSERDIFSARVDMDRVSVREVMRRPALVARPDDDLTDAAQRMVQDQIGCLPVVEEDQLIGILTRGDILTHEAKRAPLPPVTSLRVGELMKREPITIVGDDALLNAAALMMAAGVRHLPVVDHGSRLIGMLSDRNVRTAIGDPQRALHDAEVRARVRSLRVWAAMMSPPLTVREETGVTEAIQHFVDHRIGAVAVVDDGERVVGLLSYVDVLRALTQPARSQARDPGDPALRSGSGP